MVLSGLTSIVTSSTSSSSRPSSTKHWVVSVPSNLRVDQLPEDRISHITLPPTGFEKTAKALFQRFLRAFYVRQRKAAELSLTAGLQTAGRGSREYLWFVIAKAILRLDQGYVEAPEEIDAVLDEADAGTSYPPNELKIVLALRGFNRDTELMVTGLSQVVLDEKQEKLKERCKDYLMLIDELYEVFSAPNHVCTETQALFCIVYHRYIVRDFVLPRSTKLAAHPYEMALAEPRQFLDFCDKLLANKRLDLFLQNVRFRGRSVAEIGPKPIQQRLQKCITMAYSQNQVALCRYLMMRNTDHVFENPDDGKDRRFPEYSACQPLFKAAGNLVDEASCRLYQLSTNPEADQLATAAAIRQTFLDLDYPGLALDCLIDREIPLCLKREMAAQKLLRDDLIHRLQAFAALEQLVCGAHGENRPPPPQHRRLYDNTVAWMLAAQNVFTLTILIEFVEHTWRLGRERGRHGGDSGGSEPAQYQAVTLSRRLAAGHARIARTVAGPFPSRRLTRLCHDSAWRHLRYARGWGDDGLFSAALSRALHWRVALASFGGSSGSGGDSGDNGGEEDDDDDSDKHHNNDALVAELDEVAALAHAGIEKDQEEMRYGDAVEKCCVLTRVAMLHPAGPRALGDVPGYALGRLLERRARDAGTGTSGSGGGDGKPRRASAGERTTTTAAAAAAATAAATATKMLNEVAREFQFADEGARARPTSVEARARRLPKPEYERWELKRRLDGELEEFAADLRKALGKRFLAD